MINKSIISILTILIYTVKAFSVIMPGALDRDAYKYKKEYEAEFKDIDSKIVANKFQEKLKAEVKARSNEAVAVSDVVKNNDSHRDEKKNEETLTAVNSGNQPDNSPINIGDGAGSTNPPEASTNQPAGSTTPPDVPTTPPDVPTNPPEASTNQPDVPTTPPDVPTTPPDVPTTPPDVPTTPPDVPTTPPDVPTTPPDVPIGSDLGDDSHAGGNDKSHEGGNDKSHEGGNDKSHEGGKTESDDKNKSDDKQKSDGKSK